MSLPNPSVNIIRIIQNIFFKFLWSSGPDKIKRNTIFNSYEYGGLRMINLEVFMSAIKITWLRRYMMHNTKYFNLIQGFYPFIINLTKYGGIFCRNNMNIVKNSFWKDVFKGFIDLNTKTPNIMG